MEGDTAQSLCGTPEYLAPEILRKVVCGKRELSFGMWMSVMVWWSIAIELKQSRLAIRKIS